MNSEFTNYYMSIFVMSRNSDISAASPTQKPKESWDPEQFKDPLSDQSRNQS